MNLILCKNCKYFWDHPALTKATCYNPESQYSADFVYGTRYYTSCDDMRNIEAKCGIDAKLYQPKLQPVKWYRKILNLRQTKEI